MEPALSDFVFAYQVEFAVRYAIHANISAIQKPFAQRIEVGQRAGTGNDTIWRILQNPVFVAINNRFKTRRLIKQTVADAADSGGKSAYILVDDFARYLEVGRRIKRAAVRQHIQRMRWSTYAV